MKICLSCEGVTNTAAPRCGHCGAWLLSTETVHYPDRRGEADSGNPLLGTVVDGKYRLQSVLGRGGLGTVFQAVHIGSLMAVAVKLLHPRFSERPEYRRSLLPEARRAATVAHERCARLLDVGEAEDGVAYLAMELVDGDTLDVLVRNGPLAPSHALAVLTQVAEALVAIHAAGLVHCDLSPRNVMVAVKNGTLLTKVLDFGIARTAALAGAERIRAGELTGFVNPAFAAPEHLAGQEVDPRADLYSLGTLGWLLLTGGMPIDDSDARRAARAIVAGELRPWPNVPGVPRRLQRLLLSCLRLDRTARPASAAAVLRELQAVAAVHRSPLRLVSLGAVALAVVAWGFAAIDPTAPFLRLVAGSQIELLDRQPSAGTEVQYLSSRRLATLGFHFGGFPVGRLGAVVSRGGTVLLREGLRPEVDAAGGVGTLSEAQPQWRTVVESLQSSSRDGPVDVSFVVPGAAPLGSARVRLDDDAPVVDGRLLRADGGLVSATTAFSFRVDDAVGVAASAVEVVFTSGRRLELPLDAAAGEVALGREIAAATGSADDLGPGELRVVATDRAGNWTEGMAQAFSRCDVQAPSVLEATGPAGEPFLPCADGHARLRLRLSAPEDGCRLQVVLGDGMPQIELPLPGPGPVHSLELQLPGKGPLPAAGPVTMSVVDGAGNRTERQFPLALRDRSVALRFVGEGGGFVQVGGELVVDPAGARGLLHVAPTFVLARCTLDLQPGVARRDGGDPVRFENRAPGTAAIEFGELPPGSHRLRLQLEEVDGESGHRAAPELPVRVLPPAIDVRVPEARSRFLPDLLAAGVLARFGAGLREGPGWRIDPELRPYVDGTLWVGADTLVPLRLPERGSAGAALLPEIQPVPGHNVLAVELRDVLGRPVRVLVGDGATPRREHAGHELDVVADFWWHEGAPEPIGEELLVEYGQPARLRLRLPLPYRSDELALLRLGLAQSEIAASRIVAEGGSSTAEFDLPFLLWSVAAQLADRPREAYGAQIERRVDAYIATPFGRHPLVLRLRTTRSTLRPVRLQDLGAPQGPLGELRLVPVLAPDGPFAEPVPKDAPPRALFRPQVAVAVRSVPDFLLQDREFTVAEALALLALAPAAVAGRDPAELVHRDDPLGAARLAAGNLLPGSVHDAAPDESATGFLFYQSYTCCRLLGLVVAGDPDLFRLPLGCELELAAFAGATQPACNGPAAAGRPVSAVRFAEAADGWAAGRAPTAAASARAGDLVASTAGAEFVGLDFGVREWVADLPHVAGADLLLREWIGDHAVHLAKVAGFADGSQSPPPDLAAGLRTFGVVRGLPLGLFDGLLGPAGERLEPADLRDVPASVPGVLRTEQLRRDGRDLVSAQPDPRLSQTGFRVAGARELLLSLRGRR